MKLSEYSGLDATALADLIRRKQVSPEEVLETSLEALEKINGKLNAVVDYTYEYALRQIKGGIDLSSPFPGVPMVLKDCGGEAAGIRATMGTRLSGKGVYAKEDSNFHRFIQALNLIQHLFTALCTPDGLFTVKGFKLGDDCFLVFDFLLLV